MSAAQQLPSFPPTYPSASNTASPSPPSPSPSPPYTREYCFVLVNKLAVGVDCVRLDQLAEVVGKRGAAGGRGVGEKARQALCGFGIMPGRRKLQEACSNSETPSPRHIHTYVHTHLMNHMMLSAT